MKIISILQEKTNNFNNSYEEYIDKEETIREYYCNRNWDKEFSYIKGQGSIYYRNEMWLYEVYKNKTIAIFDKDLNVRTFNINE